MQKGSGTTAPQYSVHCTYTGTMDRKTTFSQSRFDFWLPFISILLPHINWQEITSILTSNGPGVVSWKTFGKCL